MTQNVTLPLFFVAKRGTLCYRILQYMFIGGPLHHLTCAHCGEPITHSTNPLLKYCNRPTCLKKRSSKKTLDRLSKKGIRSYHCKLCGRRSDMPARTPSEERICKECRKYMVGKKPEDYLCGCCNTRIRAYWLGFRAMCIPCWENHGNPDEGKQRSDTLDHRYIAKG